MCGSAWEDPGRELPGGLYQEAWHLAEVCGGTCPHGRSRGSLHAPATPASFLDSEPNEDRRAGPCKTCSQNVDPMGFESASSPETHTRHQARTSGEAGDSVAHVS